ncbi:hypothetical protein NDU88_002991 [Pleurodeles waltl]|uniref:Uncharacterized protein n=1 Tax=Pleurodeles waltl TaxID=8319 RepID=A0AAV7MPA4_PLEWA|nr:hypothetical protein NDU88_002991 [Pleurodeles waltl]
MPALAATDLCVYHAAAVHFFQSGSVVVQRLRPDYRRQRDKVHSAPIVQLCSGIRSVYGVSKPALRDPNLLKCKNHKTDDTSKMAVGFEEATIRA